MKTWLTGITLAALLLLGLLGLGSWLLYAPSGSSWLLTRVVTAQGGKIGQIEGTLGGRLQLTDLQVGWPGGQLNCANLQLVTRLQQLFPLQLEVEQLRLEKLVIDQAPGEGSGQSVHLSWPQLPWWLSTLQLNIQQLELVDFHLQQRQQEAFRIERLQSQVLWRDQSLQLTQLLLQAPDMSVEGRLGLDFANPALQSSLQVRHLAAADSWQQLNLNIDLRAAKNLLLSGPVKLSLLGNQDLQLSVEAELGLAAEELQFRQLRVQRPQRSGALLATGSLRFGDPEIGLRSRVQLSELDLQPETGQAIKLSGELDIAGTLNSYRGNFKLLNRAQKPLDVRLSGAFSGDQQQLQLSDLQGDCLNGTLSGQARLSWQQGLQAVAQLSARNLDPHLLHEQLEGDLNLQLQADLEPAEAGFAGRLQLQLEESTLHGQPLTGAADLGLDGKQLEITQLQLRGDGIRLQAAGKLHEQIKLSWQIERLEQLFSGVHGQVTGNGWFQLLAAGLAAEFTTQGQQLSANQWQLANGQLQGKTLADQHHWQLSFGAKQLSSTQPALTLDTVQLDVSGALEQHQIKLALARAGASLHGSFAGGWSDQIWQGRLTQLVGEDPQLGGWQTLSAVPLLLSAERIQVDPLEVASEGHGRLLLQGSFLPPSRAIDGRIEWQQLDLGLLQPWLSGWELAGRSSGSILVPQHENQSLSARLSLQGQLKNEKLAFNLQQGEGRADWDNQGLRSSLTLQLADGSQLEAQLTSAQKATLGWPQQGALQAQGQALDLARLQPWLAPGLELVGKLDWQTTAQWQAAAEPWTVVGAAQVTSGRMFWQEDEEIVNLQLDAANLSWNWQNRLTGEFELQLQEHGSVDARFALPLAADFPFQFDPSEPVSGELNARLQELGLLSIVFPGRVQDSRGQLKLDLQLSGNWQQPTLQGDARLFDAGAFLPTLGVQLTDIDLQSSFDHQQIAVKTLKLSSAGGSLVGQGQLQLANWRPQNYQLQLQGERFQLINLPELQARISPDLTVKGDLDSYQLRGTLKVPELLASSGKNKAQAENSPDLLIVDAAAPPERPFRLRHDIDLQLILGDKVLLNSGGIDARLDGNLRLQSNSRQELVAFGEIHVVKGKYASYGVSLDISRGNLLFNGGPLAQPSLDVLALRTVGEVQAGVKVSGTPRLPVVQLYSEPAMAETDILSYIVLGRAIGAESSQNSMLMTAAGALLSQGESAVLQEKLKSRLGLDVLDISAGDGDVNSSVITTGKYLSPDLYISLGYSLFSNSNEMKVRYSLSPDWELESSIGTESGVDLFYKIDIE